MAVAVAVAVAVSGGGAVAVAGLTKRFFNHIQKDFLIDVWVYFMFTFSFEIPNVGILVRKLTFYHVSQLLANMIKC